MLAGHQVVLGGDLRRVSEPLGDRVGRVPLHPVGFAGGPEVLEQPRPGLVASLRDNPFKVCPHVDILSGRHGDDQCCPGFTLVEGVRQDRPQFGTDRHDADGMFAAVVFGLFRQDGKASFLPVHVSPCNGADLRWAAEPPQPRQADE